MESRCSLESEQPTKSAGIVGEVSQGKEGFWWHGRCGGAGFSDQAKCRRSLVSERPTKSAGVTGRGLVRKRRLRVAWSSWGSRVFRPGEMPPLSGKRAAHEKRGRHGARSRKEKKASGDVVVAGEQSFHTRRNAAVRRRAKAVPEVRALQGKVSQISGGVGQCKRGLLTTCWRRLGYLARFQRFHALSVGAVAETLARNRQAPQHKRSAVKSLGSVDIWD